MQYDFFNVFLIKSVIKMLHNMCHILQKWHFSGTYFEVWIFPPIILLAVSVSRKEIYYKKLKSDFWQAISLLRPNQDLWKLNQMNFSYCTSTCIDVILRYFELFIMQNVVKIRSQKSTIFWHCVLLNKTFPVLCKGDKHEHEKHLLS